VGSTFTPEGCVKSFNCQFETPATPQARLGRSRDPCGAPQTEADWRLFPNLIRFDPVSYIGYKCNLRRIEEDFSEAHLRLSRVYIENRPYGQVVARFDKPRTLFYLDPPYWGCENDYGVGIFSREDFQRLAKQLDGIQGRFLLSLNDTPGVREVFGNFHIEAVRTRYSVAAKGKKEVGEVLISNFKPVSKAR